MPVEQVNAWASYGQTAKEARALNHGARDSRQTIKPTFPQELRNRRQSRSSIGVSEHSAVEGKRQSIYDSHKNALNMSRHSIGSPLIGMSVSRHGITTSRHGAKTPPKESATPDPESQALVTEPGFFESLVFEKQQVLGSKSFEGRETDLGDLEDETLATIRAAFPIFFEDPIHPEKPKKKYGLKPLFDSVNATMPWQYDTLNSDFLRFVGTCLRGVGQVYFMNNPVSGSLILIGMFIQSSRIAVHGVIALVCGTSTALLLGFDVGLVRSGLFGYNSFLVGLAVATFQSSQQHSDYNAAIMISTIVFSCFSSVIFVMLGKLLVPYKSPPLTFPFNLVTIMFLAATANMGRVEFNPVRTPALPDYESPPFDGITAKAFFAGVVRGVGQVFLADNLASGVLVLLGLAVCSRISAIAAFLGSALGAATALAIGVPGSSIEMGMFGFNSSLSVTAMFMFYTPSFGAGVLATMAGITTVLAQQALATMLEPLGLPFMTLPFCFIGLPFIIIQGTTTFVIAVPLSSMTIPEDHFRIVKMLEDGFVFLKECLEPESGQGGRFSTSRTRSKKMARSLSRLNSIMTEIGDDEEIAKTLAKRKACCGLKRDPDAGIKLTALALFKKLDHKKYGSIHIEDLVQALREAGLIDKEGLHFARLILTLMDVDDSSTIDEKEFVAFAVVGTNIDTIRKKLLKFFAFVDVDGNGEVDFDEINAALQYLGQPTLTELESDRLLALTGTEDDGINVIDLLNVVTVHKVQTLAEAFHCGRSSVALDLTNNESSKKDGVLDA